MQGVSWAPYAKKKETRTLPSAFEAAAMSFLPGNERRLGLLTEEVPSEPQESPRRCPCPVVSEPATAGDLTCREFQSNVRWERMAHVRKGKVAVAVVILGRKR